MLEDCLLSIKQNAPQNHRIVAVDGAYKAFNDHARILAAELFEEGNDALAECFLKYTAPTSTDGSYGILRRFGAELYTHPEGLPWPDEITKRNEYLRGQAGDYYCVIDADERLIGKFPDEAGLSKSDVWTIKLYRDDNIPPYPILRVFKHIDGMKYEGAHHAMWYGDKLIKTDDVINAGFVLQDCHLWHRWKYRGDTNQIRHQAKGAYYRYLLEKSPEKDFRAKHGV